MAKSGQQADSRLDALDIWARQLDAWFQHGGWPSGKPVAFPWWKDHDDRITNLEVGHHQRTVDPPPPPPVYPPKSK